MKRIASQHLGNFVTLVTPFWLYSGWNTKQGQYVSNQKAHRLWTSLAVWWRIVYFLLDFWRHLKCLSKQIAEVIERQRHYFANKGPSSQGYGFSSGHVWMWELDCEEIGAPKNWCFWTVVLEKTLESPLDCKEIQAVHSEGDQPWDFLEGKMLKLKLQYFGHLMQRADSLQKTLMLGGIGGRRRRGRQRMRWLDGITDSMTWVWMNSRSWWWTGRPGMLRFMGSQRVGHDWVTELNWTDFFPGKHSGRDRKGGRLFTVFTFIPFEFWTMWLYYLVVFVSEKGKPL